MKRVIGIGLAFSLAACGGGEKSLGTEAQQQRFTEAVESVAYTGSEQYELDERVPCDFGLLAGELVVQKILADESDYAAAVVEDGSGDVPEFGLIQCFDGIDGKHLVRGNDGY